MEILRYKPDDFKESSPESASSHKDNTLDLTQGDENKTEEKKEGKTKLGTSHEIIPEDLSKITVKNKGESAEGEESEEEEEEEGSNPNEESDQNQSKSKESKNKDNTEEKGSGEEESGNNEEDSK